jgi:hypothetical protein
MNSAFKKGIGFGLSSAVIATLAIIVGMHSGTDLKHVVVSAVLVIAFADSLADSLAVLLSEKEDKNTTAKEVWLTTITAFLSKLIFALTFLIAIFIFNLHLAIWVDIIYGLTILAVYSFNIAKSTNKGILKTISLHILLAIVVIAASHGIGTLIGNLYQ